MSELIERNAWAELRRFTSARIALGRAGNSLPTEEVLQFGLAHAQARDAVHQRFEPERVEAGLRLLGLESLLVHSAAPDRLVYLRRPDLGRRLNAASCQILAAARSDPAAHVALVVADGLSARAIHDHAIPLLASLLPMLKEQDWRLAPVVIAQQSRVALGDEIGELLGAEMVAILIGERPGLSSPDSMGIYLTHAPRVGRMDSERNCISNIRPQGLNYEQAARRLLFLLSQARRLRLTGVRLKDDSDVPNLMRAEATEPDSRGAE
jgi:ethanolamine ammonia-lyase small subunit